jgi:hypothetical protein
MDTEGRGICEENLWIVIAFKFTHYFLVYFIL